MYPVYPELGWIHSVSSVSQLSEAAYTRALSGSRSLMPIQGRTKLSHHNCSRRRRGEGRGGRRRRRCRRRHKGRRACAAPRAIRVRVEGHRRRRSQANTSFGHSKKTCSSSKPEAVYLTVYPLCIQTECGFTCILCVQTPSGARLGVFCSSPFDGRPQGGGHLEPLARDSSGGCPGFKGLNP